MAGLTLNSHILASFLSIGTIVGKVELQHCLMNTIIPLARACLLVCIASCAMAQETQPRPVPAEITTVNNTVINGKILGIARDSVTIKSDYGIQRIAVRDIRSISYLDSLKSTTRWFEAPNQSRYLFSSTAIPLRKGEVMLSSTYLVIASAQYGMADNLSIGGGFEAIGMSLGYVSFRYTFLNRDRHKLSTGLSYFYLPEDFIEFYSGEDLRGLGLVTATSTWGNSNTHFSLGAAYLYAAGGFVPPLITVSATARFAKNFAFVTENWLITAQRSQTYGILSLGVRYMGKMSSFDLAFYTDHKSPLDAYFPYIAYAIKLGR